MEKVSVLDQSRLSSMIQSESHTVIFRFYRLYLDQLRSFISFAKTLRLPEDRYELVQQVHKHKSSAKVVGADLLVTELERIERSILSETNEIDFDLEEVIEISRATLSQVEDIVEFRKTA